MAVKDTFSLVTYGWKDPDADVANGRPTEPYIYRFGCIVDNETMWAAGAQTESDCSATLHYIDTSKCFGLFFVRVEGSCRGV